VEGGPHGNVIAKKFLHGPADVLQTVLAMLVRPRRLDHLLHDEHHDDTHVRPGGVDRVTGDGVLAHNLHDRERHCDSTKCESLVQYATVFLK
jgi:hypothetical protein